MCTGIRSKFPLTFTRLHAPISTMDPPLGVHEAFGICWVSNFSIIMQRFSPLPLLSGNGKAKLYLVPGQCVRSGPFLQTGIPDITVLVS